MLPTGDGPGRHIVSNGLPAKDEPGGCVLADVSGPGAATITKTNHLKFPDPLRVAQAR